MKKKDSSKISASKSNKDPGFLKPAGISFREIFRSAWLPSLISVFILLILFSFRKIANFDLGFHLEGGRWILENMAFPVKDTFTYTLSSNEYIDIQWLYQVLMFAIQNYFSYSGLTLFNTAAIFLVFLLMLKRNNLNGVPVFISVIFLLITLICIHIRFSYRPEIFTWIFLILILIILDRNFYGEKTRLYFLPLIMLFWVNMHGLFILGFVILGAYIFSGYIHYKKTDKNLLKWTLISAAAVFINPYFSEGVMFPFYLFTRLQKGNIFQLNIQELQPPWGMGGLLSTELYIYYSVSVITFILLFLTLKHRKFHEFALASALFYISFTSFRNIPVFMIYAFFIISVSVSDLIREKNKFSSFLSSAKTIRIFSVIIISFCFLTGIRVVTGAYYVPYGSDIIFGAGTDESKLPFKAADFMNANNLKGNIFNNLEYGGWLEWLTKQKVSIDGRLEVVKEEFFREYISTINNNTLNSMLVNYPPSFIVNDISNYKWTGQINASGQFSLIYWDANSAVYKLFNEAANSRDFSFSFKSGLLNENIDTVNFSSEESNSILGSLKIRDFGYFLKGFYHFQNDPVYLLNMGNFAFDHSQGSAVEILYLNYIKKNGGYVGETQFRDILTNLGTLYSVKGDTDKAQFCFERFLSEFPGDNKITGMLNDLKNRRKK
ncbi:MAG: hypothetical protein JSS91_08585 [Bacteroidetes bacterium]|nr:hypothetical protein [Bacteroidota bacterium]